MQKQFSPTRVIRWLTVLSVSMISLSATTTFAQGTALTYQGRLNDGASPATGIYDLRFTIYAAASGGSIAAGPVDAVDVSVSKDRKSVV